MRFPEPRFRSLKVSYFKPYFSAALRILPILPLRRSSRALANKPSLEVLTLWPIHPIFAGFFRYNCWESGCVLISVRGCCLHFTWVVTRRWVVTQGNTLEPRPGSSVLNTPPFCTEVNVAFAHKVRALKHFAYWPYRQISAATGVALSTGYRIAYTPVTPPYKNMRGRHCILRTPHR